MACPSFWLSVGEPLCGGGVAAARVHRAVPADRGAVGGGAGADVGACGPGGGGRSRCGGRRGRTGIPRRTGRGGR